MAGKKKNERKKQTLQNGPPNLHNFLNQNPIAPHPWFDQSKQNKAFDFLKHL